MTVEDKEFLEILENRFEPGVYYKQLVGYPKVYKAIGNYEIQLVKSRNREYKTSIKTPNRINYIRRDNIK
jgi:hypothetical protein